MKFHTFPLALGLAAVTASAYKVSFKQFKRPTLQRRAGGISASDVQLSVLASADSNSLDLNTVHDLIYMADITVGGNELTVQLDTGSSDLWIKGATFPLPNSHPTGTNYNLSYAIGWAYGNLSYAAVQFANLSVPSQAFLDVSLAQNPTLGYGANGILGLGFNSLSQLDYAVNKTGGSTGRSLLYNLFQANPDEPNFLSFALQRSTEAHDEVEGSFSIGEYEPKYAAVANQTKVPTWPVNSPTRWNVLLDAVIVNHLNDRIVLPATTVVGAPSNKAVILLDSGSSFTYAPKAICDAVYGSIPGAKFDTKVGQWVVPCDYEVDMALQIGGQVFPVHPLDVTPSGLATNNVCVGSFVPQTVSVGAGEFDWLVGDNFLRSVYSIYDFGDFDEPGIGRLPPSAGGQPKTNITYTGLNGAAAMPSFNISQDISDSLEKIGRYLPAMLAVVALNALILLVLAIAGTVIYCRRRRNPRARARATPGRMSPMPMNPRHSYVPGSGLPPPEQSHPHVYEPVSMALTEDTFVPPSPAFHSFDGKPGNRPKSVA
ncbi:putative acid protease [Lyophyllum shimeji]|uniref:Acid protease n=1 Tax=Lyophyllum shimeji TaxID=47721 RepID=A0A9P3UJV9_LYOSH|nr:putative acid protease [Lyophyllum shimeji]